MNSGNSILGADQPQRCHFYIDGYNWYHAIFKYKPEWKWLNIPAFCAALRPRDNLQRVKLFSAIVDPANSGSDARMRQERYFKALKTIPKFSIILGLFQYREVVCRADCRKVYPVAEEKKTDVNIAVEMMADAVNDACNLMCVVSGDSDLQPVVEWISRNRPNIRLVVYVPALPSQQKSRRTDYYSTRGLNVECRFLPLDNIPNLQLKATVKLPDGSFAVRPASWNVSGP